MLWIPLPKGWNGWKEGQRNFFVINVCLNVPPCFRVSATCFLRGLARTKEASSHWSSPPLACPYTWSKIMTSLNKQSNQHPLYPARQVSLLSTDITLGTDVGKLPARHAKQLLPLIKWVDGILQVAHTVHKGTVHWCWLFHYNKTCKESNKYQMLMHICGI